jgi:hypothetical protein
MHMMSLLLLSLLALNGRPDPVRLRWEDPAGRQPVKYATWQAAHATDARSGIGPVKAGTDGTVVAIVVNAAIYPDLVTELDQFSADLTTAGWAPRIDTTRSTNAPALRAYLQGITNLAGAILVGDLPIAWYESDWGGGEPEEFPCDLYFSDLDGTWTDSDADGLYDDHSGNVAPEIWVGRLYAGTLTWDSETRLLRRYFAKNHLYRTGGLALPDRALSFVDDDWAGSGKSGLDSLYTDVTLIENSAQTTAARYRTELLAGYEWIHVMCHSSPWGNTFKVASGYAGTVFNCEIHALRPHAHFYNLFQCSGARFVEENYSAGWAIFNDDWGLAAVGSSKTGSMIGMFEDFYAPMKTACIGDAFRHWFNLWGEYDRDWHYGLCILGDPTLRPRTGGVARALPPAPQAGRDPGADIVGADPETDANPALCAAPDGKLWAAWQTPRTPANGRFDIYGAYRTAAGWSQPMPIGNAYYWERDAALGIDGQDRPVCVWSRLEDTYHYNLCYSVWNGSSWSAAAIIGPDDPGENGRPALVRASTGTLWCFWETRRDYYASIYASRWNGTSWTAPQSVTPEAVDNLAPTATADTNGHVWLSYTHATPAGSQIRVKEWDGATWTDRGAPSAAQARALCPAASRDDAGEIHVVWQAASNDHVSIFASRWTGSAWAAPAEVTPEAAIASHPDLSTDCYGRATVVWQQRDSTGWRIGRSACFGDIWYQAADVATGGYNMNPRITRLGIVNQVVWQNYQPGGNWEIYADSVAWTGIAETPQPAPARQLLAPSLVRNVLVLNSTIEYRQSTICDASGRFVSNLHAGPNNVSTLQSGVYFIRTAAATRPVPVTIIH